MAQITDINDARAFVFAGRATVTVVSTTTGARYTYRVDAPKKARDESAPPLFVRVLAGPDNSTDYVYVGAVFADRSRLVLTKASRFNDESGPVRAFRYLLGGLAAGRFGLMEIWHEGRCGRCGRKLTVPESIETGIGPVCAGRGA